MMENNLLSWLTETDHAQVQQNCIKMNKNAISAIYKHTFRGTAQATGAGRERTVELLSYSPVLEVLHAGQVAWHVQRQTPRTSLGGRLFRTCRLKAVDRKKKKKKKSKHGKGLNNPFGPSGRDTCRKLGPGSNSSPGFFEARWWVRRNAPTNFGGVF